MAAWASALARGAGANLVGTLSRLLRPIFVFAAATLYGSASFGIYMLAWVVVDLCGKVATFGLDKGLMRFVPLAEQAGRPAARTEILGAALRGTFIAGAALTGAVALTAPLVAHFYRMPELKQALILLSPAIATSALSQTLSSALMAVGLMRGQIAIRGVLEPALLIVLSVAFRLLFGTAVYGLALAHGAAGVLAVFAMVAVFGRTFSLRDTLRAALGRARLPGLFRFSIPMWASDGVTILQQRADLLVFARMRPEPVLVGMYALAKQLANVVNVVRFSFDPVFWPRVAALSEVGDRPGLSATYKLVARWVALLALPLALVLAMFGPELLRALGQDYRGPLLVTAFLVLGQTFNSLFGLAGHLMAMAGEPLVALWGYLTGACMAALGTVLLVPRFGVVGAAAASALAFVCIMTHQVLLAWRRHGVQPLSWGLGKVVSAGLVMAIALEALWHLVPALAAVALAFALYLLAFRALGPEPVDFELYASLRRRFARRPA